MVPEFSLLFMRALTDKEIGDLTGQDVKYLEENYESTGYKVFSFGEKEKHKLMSLFMRPIILFGDDELATFYIIYLEPYKSYDARTGIKYAIENGLTMWDGSIMPGYFSPARLSSREVVRDTLNMMSDTAMDGAGDWSIIFHTCDSN